MHPSYSTDSTSSSVGGSEMESENMNNNNNNINNNNNNINNDNNSNTDNDYTSNLLKNSQLQSLKNFVKKHVSMPLLLAHMIYSKWTTCNGLNMWFAALYMICFTVSSMLLVWKTRSGHGPKTRTDYIWDFVDCVVSTMLLLALMPLGNWMIPNISESGGHVFPVSCFHTLSESNVNTLCCGALLLGISYFVFRNKNGEVKTINSVEDLPEEDDTKKNQ
eukprot:gb/GECH01008079.1/.p1 GENE.gb/GECH01008079.1/~~gb/GECH01008079.1/.p1  ORF type:complete len:219 (+),score=30.76 gb/GECH01008079.1/:1-657(+)